MFWFVVFSSFLGADVALMKSTLMLGPFSTETQCWRTGAVTLERVIAIDPETQYRGVASNRPIPKCCRRGWQRALACANWRTSTRFVKTKKLGAETRSIALHGFGAVAFCF